MIWLRALEVLLGRIEKDGGEERETVWNQGTSFTDKNVQKELHKVLEQNIYVNVVSRSIIVLSIPTIVLQEHEILLVHATAIMRSLR